MVAPAGAAPNTPTAAATRTVAATNGRLPIAYLPVRCRRSATFSASSKPGQVQDSSVLRSQGSGPRRRISPGMSASAPHGGPGPPTIIEPRIRKIANARSITLSLALTFLGLSLVGAVAIRFLDESSFPSYGQRALGALQTVSTVGYGELVW